MSSKPIEDAIDTAADRWAVQGGIFRPIGEGGRTPVVPPGVYSLETPPFGGWFLAQRGSHYELPFKIYGTHDHIINRVSKAWDLKGGNLSVLFNGLKGTGKTVSAQLLANWAIERQMPVISLSGYTPAIEEMLNQLKQPVLILFDEFEKNFVALSDDDGSSTASTQQRMLSVIDGLSRSQYRRLFLFTSNNKKLDENMIDRPSRIRYIFEFENLAESIISELLDDILLPETRKFKEDIIEYTKTLKVLSMDAIKVIAEEVNIFEEPPECFKNIINLSEKVPWHYTVDIIDPVTKEPVRQIKDKKVYPTSFNRLKSYSDMLNGENHYEIGDGLTLYGQIGPKEFIVSIAVPRDKTWMGKVTDKKDREIISELISSYSNFTIQEDPYSKVGGKSFLDRFSASSEEQKREIINEIYNSNKQYGDKGVDTKFPVRFAPVFDSPNWKEGDKRISKSYDFLDY